MSIELPPDLIQAIREEVSRGAFPSEAEAVVEIVRRYFKRKGPSEPFPNVPDQYIWEIADNICEMADPDDWEELPADGAQEHDHYIYGKPKR